MGLLTRWDERWVKQHWTAGWPVHTVRPHPFLQRTPVQRGHLLSGATLCAALCVSVWSGQRTGMYDLTEQEKKMCLWKSRRTKALQWWMLEDSAGDLRCLGGERGPTSFTWMRGIIQSFCSIYWTCAAVYPIPPARSWCWLNPVLHQLLLRLSCDLFLSSMLHQMMVHWESHYGWKTKICLFLPERIHSAHFCLAVLFSTQESNSFLSFYFIF